MRAVTPGKNKVLEHVCWYVSGYTRIPPREIQADWVLRENPLAFDDIQLGYLALTLRGYVQHYEPSATILAKEARGKGLTVGGLASLVAKKIGA